MTDPNELTLDTLAAKWSDRFIAVEADAREFVDDCERLIGGGFHPDNRMDDYIRYTGRERPSEYTASGSWRESVPLFTADEARILDARLDAAFAVLGEAGIDIYGLSLDLFHHYENQENSK